MDTISSYAARELTAPRDGEWWTSPIGTRDYITYSRRDGLVGSVGFTEGFDGLLGLSREELIGRGFRPE